MPATDAVILANNVQVAATTSVISDILTLSPNRANLVVKAFALTAGGAAVAGCSLVHQFYVASPYSGGTFTRVGWYTVDTTILPPDGSAVSVALDFDALGNGILPSNFSARYRVLLVAGANEGYISAIATAGAGGSSSRPNAVQAVSVDATLAGDNTIIAAPTTSLRVRYLSLSADAANAAAVTAIVKFGVAGTTLYKVSLSPGANWTRDLLEQWLIGTAALIVNLSGAQSVFVSTEYVSF